MLLEDQDLWCGHSSITDNELNSGFAWRNDQRDRQTLFLFSGLLCTSRQSVSHPSHFMDFPRALKPGSFSPISSEVFASPRTPSSAARCHTPSFFSIPCTRSLPTMLEDLADALFFYLAPILSLVGPLLVLLSFISPESRMGNQPSLVVIKPSSNSSTTPDGPSFFIGLLSRSIVLRVLGGTHSVF